MTVSITLIKHKLTKGTMMEETHTATGVPTPTQHNRSQMRLDTKRVEDAGPGDCNHCSVLELWLLVSR